MDGWQAGRHVGSVLKRGLYERTDRQTDRQREMDVRVAPALS